MDSCWGCLLARASCSLCLNAKSGPRGVLTGPPKLLTQLRESSVIVGKALLDVSKGGMSTAAKKSRLEEAAKSFMTIKKVSRCSRLEGVVAVSEEGSRST
jgi:hypothetical protein